MSEEPCEWGKLYVEEEFVCRDCIASRKAWVADEYSRQLRKRIMMKRVKAAGQSEQLRLWGSEV